MAYLGYGYLDTWHGSGTLVLLPCFALGVALAGKGMVSGASLGAAFRPSRPLILRTASGLGRTLLLATAAGLILAGATIMALGMTTVFVPQDLEYMGVTADDLRAVNPRLVPLIAHDRAGFGGGVCCFGLTLFLCVWCGAPSRALWQAIALAGGAAFATAIGVHPAVGYTSLTHLGPALIGATMFTAGITLSYRGMCGPRPT